MNNDFNPIQNARKTSMRMLEDRVENLPMELLKPARQSLRDLSHLSWLTGAGMLTFNTLFNIVSLFNATVPTITQVAISIMIGIMVSGMLYLFGRALTAHIAVDISKWIRYPSAVNDALHPHPKRWKRRIIIGLINNCLTLMMMASSGDLGSPEGIRISIYVGLMCSAATCWVLECAFLLSLLKDTPPRKRQTAKQREGARIPGVPTG